MSRIAQAKQLQGQGQHEQAVALINQEITEQPLKAHLKLKNVDIFDLLETRVFSLEKLRKWNSAKADASEMIKLRPKDPRGYIRKGHIFYENGHFGRAAQMYRQAMNCVDKSSQTYSKLSKQYEKLKARTTIKFVDPLSKLPAELLYTIFEQSITGSMDLVRLMLVSKGWNQYIRNEPKYWTKLQFTGDKSISHTTLERFMARSDGRALHLRVVPVVRKSERFPKMLKRYKNFQSLQFDSDCITLDELVRESANYPFLCHLKIGCVNIEEMLVWALENLPSLRSLELFQTKPYNIRTITTCKVKAPIQHLALTGYSNVLPCITNELIKNTLLQAQLESFSLHRILADIQPISSILSSSTSIKIGFTACCNKATESPTAAKIDAPVRHLTLNRLCFQWNEPQKLLPLEYLEVKWSQFPSEWGLSTLIKHFQCSQTLENLIVERNSISCGLSSSDEQEIYPSLKNLYLVAMPIPVTANFMDWVCTSMPNLQYANFNETPIDGRGIVRLVRLGVKQIRCRNGGAIDPETLSWALKNGTRVILGK